MEASATSGPGFDERAHLRRRGAQVRPAQETSADEEDRIDRVLRQLARELRASIPPADHREGRPQAAERRQQTALNRLAVAQRERKSSAGVRIDHDIAARETEEVAQRSSGAIPWCGASRLPASAEWPTSTTPEDLGERRAPRRAEEQRRDHRGANAGLAKIIDALAQAIDGSGQVRHVEAAVGRSAVGARDVLGHREARARGTAPTAGRRESDRPSRGRDRRARNRRRGARARATPSPTGFSAVGEKRPRRGRRRAHAARRRRRPVPESVRQQLCPASRCATIRMPRCSEMLPKSRFSSCGRSEISSRHG